MTNYPTNTTTYNPSELAILQSLDADTTSFNGRHFSDPVCLLGHKTVGRQILNLDGAVFHEDVTLSMTCWDKVSIQKTVFKQGLYMRMATMSHISASGVEICGVADFVDLKTESANFLDATLPVDVYARPDTLIFGKIQGAGASPSFARQG